MPDVLTSARLAALAASAGAGGVECVLVKAVDLGTPEADGSLGACSGYVLLRATGFMLLRVAVDVTRQCDRG
jgi:hypothetical protein